MRRFSAAAALLHLQVSLLLSILPNVSIVTCFQTTSAPFVSSHNRHCSRFSSDVTPATSSSPPSSTTTQLFYTKRDAPSSRLNRKYKPTPTDSWQTQINPVMADLMKLIIFEKYDDLDAILMDYRDYFILPFASENFDVETMDADGIFKEGMTAKERLEAYKTHMETKMEETDSKILKKLWGKVLSFVVEESQAAKSD